MPQHHLITDPYLHEPKGIATAAEGYVYVSDGVGSGSWRPWPLGKATYQHSTTGQIISTTAAKLQINGLGASSNVTRLPREIRVSGQLWDGVGYKLTPIRINDGYLVRIQLPVTAESGTPATIKLQFDVGGLATPSNSLYETFVRVGNTTPYDVSYTTSMEIANSLAAANGVTIFCSTNTGTVTLGSPLIYIQKVTDGLL